MTYTSTCHCGVLSATIDRRVMACNLDKLTIIAVDGASF